jgi:hypothetical protein
VAGELPPKILDQGQLTAGASHGGETAGTDALEAPHLPAQLGTWERNYWRRAGGKLWRVNEIVARE